MGTLRSDHNPLIAKVSVRLKRAMPSGQNNRVAEQGRNAVEAERAPAERNVRFEPRQTRSNGPAPNIPNVLPNAPERSAAVCEELIRIHDAHENRARDAEN